jgi:hypothetical protein
MYVLKKSDVPVSQTEWFGFWLMQGVEICSAETSLAKPDGPVSKTGGSAISRNSEELAKQRRLNLMIGEHPWYII